MRSLISSYRATTSASKMILLARSSSACNRRFISGQRHSFMSSMTVASTEEDTHFALILGKPGGGKGTISGKILKDFPQFHHISTGDLLREHVRAQTKIGKEASKYMNEGKLVPDDLIIGLVMEEATPNLEQGKSLLLDGFPRNVYQAQHLEEVVHVDLVINLDVPTDTIVDRIADRWIHPASGRIYSYSYKAPKVHGKDDFTGEDLVQRPDDNPDKVRTRLEAYEEVTSPLVNYYDEMGVLKSFHGTMSDVIYPNVKQWLTKRFH